MPKPAMTVFRENIVFLLEHTHRTQRQLAHHLGIDDSHLSHFLRYRPKSKPALPSPAKRKAKPKGKKKDNRKNFDRNLSGSYLEPIAEYFAVPLWRMFLPYLGAGMAEPPEK